MGAKDILKISLIVAIAASSGCKKADDDQNVGPGSASPLARGGGPSPVAAEAPSNATATPNARGMNDRNQPAPPAMPGSASNVPSSNIDTNNAANVRNPNAPTAQGGGARDLSEGDILGVTRAVNQGEVQQSQLARSRARSEDVRQFADQMITQHQNFMQQDHQFATRTGVAPQPSTLSRQLEQSASSTMRTLEGATANDFDRQYIDAQIRGHEQAIETISGTLLPSAQNGELRQSLMNVRTAAEQHLQHARAIQASLNHQGGTNAPGAPMPTPANPHPQTP
jgi:putative membrane protein